MRALNHFSPVLLVAILVMVTSLFLLPPGWGFIPAGILVLLGYLALRRASPSIALFGFASAVLCALCSIPALTVTWPLPLLLAIGAGALLSRFVPVLSGTGSWWRKGTVRRRDLPWTALFIVVPGLSLVAWQQIMRPDLADLVARIPHLDPLLLVLAGLVFSMANALAEEAFFRGIMWEALSGVIRRPLLVLALQAASFGISHIQGFPRGWVGVILAAFYGAMMGELRRRTKGLLLPWFAHVFADCVIFGTLAFSASAPFTG